MNRRTRRSAVLNRRRLSDTERITMAHTIGQMRAQRTWYKLPARSPLTVTATRVEFDGLDLRPFLKAEPKVGRHGVSEHWADTLLNCPPLSGNRRTARFAGKPYHWRQDYTGQLKLAAGESPW